MSEHKWFDDFKVGDAYESPSKTLNDAHFMFFAGMTGDAHPIHYDDEYAKGTRFGRRLAPELGLSLVKATVAIALAFAGYGVWSLVWGQLAGVATWTLASWLVVGWRPRARIPSPR